MKRQTAGKTRQETLNALTETMTLCEREMFAPIRWGKRTLAVPLAQLEAVEADERTREAVEDWLYWVGMGYEF